MCRVRGARPPLTFNSCRSRAWRAPVSGSGQGDGPVLAELREVGVDARAGHAAGNVPAGDDVEVVYSSAIPTANPERAAARARGLKELPRAALLAELSALKRTIA